MFASQENVNSEHSAPTTPLETVKIGEVISNVLN